MYSLYICLLFIYIQRGELVEAFGTTTMQNVTHLLDGISIFFGLKAPPIINKILAVLLSLIFCSDSDLI